MAVHVRFQRVGKKKKAFYRLVAVDSRKRRDGRPIEIMGNYNPAAADDGLTYNQERMQYWLSQGAQASDRVRTTLIRKGDWGLLKKNLKT